MPDPARLGDYELLDELGHGAFGRVYKARSRTLGAIRALKVYAGLPDPEALERFHREARTLARIHGPGVVAVHDTGTDRGRAWFAMDYMPGGSLADLVRANPSGLPWREAVSLAAKLARVLERAAAAGLVHRDVKPANVLLDDRGEPHLADFGLVRDPSQPPLTATGTSMGTLAYMAPEQLDGRTVDPKADVYSLALVLHELLTGQRARQGTTPLALMNEMRSRPRVKIDAAVLGAPRELESILARAHALSPAERPTASELATSLEGLVAGSRPKTRRPSLALPAGLLALLGGAVLIALLSARSGPPASPPPVPGGGGGAAPSSATAAPTSSSVIALRRPARKAAEIAAQLEGASASEILAALEGVAREDVDDPDALGAKLRDALERASATCEAKDVPTLARAAAKAREVGLAAELGKPASDAVERWCRANYEGKHHNDVAPSEIEKIGDVLLGVGSKRAVSAFVPFLQRRAVFRMPAVQALIERLRLELPGPASSYLHGLVLYRRGDERKEALVKEAQREFKAALDAASKEKEKDDSIGVVAYVALVHATERADGPGKALKLLEPRIGKAGNPNLHRLRAHCLDSSGASREEVVAALDEGLTTMRRAGVPDKIVQVLVESRERVAKDEPDWHDRLGALFDY